MENTAHSFTEGAEYIPADEPQKLIDSPNNFKPNLMETDLTLKQRALNMLYDLLLLIVGLISTVYILKILWSWIAPALNMPALTFAEALTFIVFIKLITFKLPKNFKEELGNSETVKQHLERRLYILAVQLFGMAIASSAIHLL